MQFAGVLADCTLAETGTTAELLQRALVAQLAHSERLTDVQLPEPDEPSARHALPDGEPRIVLNDGVVSYNDRPILHHLSWRVNPGEHWQIVGPNGAGKSTLLSLITGDHPQGYSNDLTLFGRRRGSGETIWDIKNISATSAAVYIWITASVPRYAMSFSPAISILSAFTVPFQTGNENWRNSGWIFWESISVRRMPLPQSFRGQQRLALIVRALVKHPTVLILDEPLQGLDPLNRQLVRRFVDVLIRRRDPTAVRFPSCRGCACLYYPPAGICTRGRTL